MSVYLDLCSIQRPLDDQSQLRVRLEAEAILAFISACEAGQAEMLSSDALQYEAGRNPNPVRRAHALGALGKATRMLRSSAQVESRARKLERAGLKPLDALHLAFAIEAGADYFCTCDDRLLRRARNIQTGPPKVVSPLELIGEISP